MNLEQELSRRIKGKIYKDEPMARHTSWQVGGPADYLVEPAGREDLVEIICFCNEHGLPIMVFGNGTNLLVLDGGIRGLVVKIGSPFQYAAVDGTMLKAGAGEPMPSLARFAARNGLGGLEFAGGIPGTLGGALVMNAGAFGYYIGNLIQSVVLVDLSGEEKILTAPQIEFGYRWSSLSGSGIIVEATLQLEQADPVRLQEKVEAFMAERRRRHPHMPSAGSVFRNPPAQPAGRMIEAAGGKGMQIGAAQVSPQHANFIINRGGATAADILALIRAVQKLVRDRFGIELQTEVRVVGEES